jgi:hypothetical protein
MTWIKTVPVEEAGPDLLRFYEAIYRLYPPEYRDAVPAVQRSDGGSDHVTSAHSLIPEAMVHAMSLFGVLVQPDLPLSRRQHEMIAAVVSADNRCFY